MAQINVLFGCIFKNIQPFSRRFAGKDLIKSKYSLNHGNPTTSLMPKVTRQICLFRPTSSKHIKKDKREVISIDQEDGGVVDENVGKQKSEERMFLIQPDFKWGKGRFLSKAVHSRLDEAEALVKSVSNWQVTSKTIESIHDLNSKYYFGSGKLGDLKEKVQQLKRANDISAIFVNTGKLTQKQANGLEEIFGCKIYDRYGIVLEIFKERARTKEAKLQVKLAELKYKKSHLTTQDSNFDQQAGGFKSIGGGGETYLEVQKRLLSEKEAKIKKELHHVENQRKQTRTERVNKHVAQIALIGYTNAGKTTLARALSGDIKLEPEDKLFATLDTTVHRGKLPCGMGVVYIDTVGFITDLPHELIQSFSATLEDVKNSNLLVHVRDFSNPEHEHQKKSVLEVLKSLDVDKTLLDSMIEVHNKADLQFGHPNSEEINDENSDEKALPVSALHGSGVEDLKYNLEQAVFERTGRRLYQIKVDSAGQGLSWLHHNTTVVSSEAIDNDQLEVQCVMDSAMYSKWQATFCKSK